MNYNWRIQQTALQVPISSRLVSCVWMLYNRFQDKTQSTTIQYINIVLFGGREVDEAEHTKHHPACVRVCLPV